MDSLGELNEKFGTAKYTCDTPVSKLSQIISKIIKKVALKESTVIPAKLI